MEYFPLGDLQGYMSSLIPESEVQQITFQLLEGLNFMHQNSFAHRDLKPSNVFIKSHGPDWWVKIGDFGISNRAEEGLTALRTFSGTLGFLAPEVLAQNGLLDWDELEGSREYTAAVDLWSLGEIIFRALTNRPPFARGLATYIRGKSSFPEDTLRIHLVTTDGCDFIKKLLKPMPRDRPTAEEALAHPWIESQIQSSPRSSIEMKSLQVAISTSHLDIPSPPRSKDTVTSMTMASAKWTTTLSEDDSTRRSFSQANSSLTNPAANALSNSMKHAAGEPMTGDSVWQGMEKGACSVKVSVE